ncbi:MAG: sugar transferase [Actinomycetota bacterium]|nr:sugar transferase [Actinomycetota bacterium]
MEARPTDPADPNMTYDDLGPEVMVAAESDSHLDAPYRTWVRLAVVGDVMAAAIGAVLARTIRFGSSGAVLSDADWITVSYGAIGMACLVAWPLITALCGGYDLRTQLFGVEELRRLMRSGISLLALLAVAVFAMNAVLSRGFVLALVPFTVGFSALFRLALRARSDRRQARGRSHHKVVAVGPTDELERLCRQLLSQPKSAIDIVAYVADDAGRRPASGPLALIRQLPDRDAIADLQQQGVQIDMLVRAGRPLPDEMWRLARRAHELDAVLAVAPHREDASSHVAVSYVPLGHTPLMVVETPSMRPSARWIKGAFDRVVGLAMLVVLTPVLLVIAGLLLLRQGRPILYSQERVGRSGSRFRCFKFRTMSTDADERLQELRELNEADGPLFKIREDPRVTPMGRWLRAHSLDELPQIFNVLAGSMSIVGPRPPLPSETAAYNEREARRLLVKPGLTGLWQVEGRSDLPWDDGVYLDLLYVEHWSPLLDIVIIARTIRAVVRPSGAY